MEANNSWKGLKLKNERNSVKVGKGEINISLKSYSDHDTLEGYSVSLYNHGAATSGVEYIDMSDAKLRGAEKSNTHNAVVLWGNTFYYYDNADITQALAVFTATNSLGKTANVIKATGTVKFTADLDKAKEAVGV